MNVVRMYRGEHQTLEFGPFTLDNGDAVGTDLESVSMAIVDDIDDPAVTVEPAGEVTIDDAETWSFHVVLAPQDTEELAASLAGTVYRFTLACEGADNSVRMLPVDNKGAPAHGTIVLYERATG